jgi:hypothetical protein
MALLAAAPLLDAGAGEPVVDPDPAPEAKEREVKDEDMDPSDDPSDDSSHYGPSSPEDSDPGQRGRRRPGQARPRRRAEGQARQRAERPVDPTSRSIHDKIHRDFPTAKHWAEGVRWNKPSHKKEALVLCVAADRFDDSGVDIDNPGLEVIYLRLAALEMADVDGNWECADGLLHDITTNNLVSRQLRAQLLRDAARRRKLKLKNRP